jgi:integrase
MRDAELVGENPIALAALRLLLLTGLRRMEALALRHSSVDGPARCIRFEDTKSGPQLRPIGAMAVLLIEAQRVRDFCPWVFPSSHSDGHFVGLPKVLERICARAGLEGVTIHVLRHSFRRDGSRDGLFRTHDRWPAWAFRSGHNRALRACSRFSIGQCCRSRGNAHRIRA